MDLLKSLMEPPAGHSFSASGENVTGGSGCAAQDDPGAFSESAAAFGQVGDSQQPHPARELGRGWKVRPWIALDPQMETPLLDVDGPGIVRHIWCTVNAAHLRRLILKMYWDGEETPSVCVPAGDFFCNAAKFTGSAQSLAMCVNPLNGMNCYLPMPFRKQARITVTSLENERINGFYYCVDFTREPVAAEACYLHASFRRANPLAYGTEFTIADGIRGAGRFAGCYLAWRQNNDGWWGEGEVKMYLDADRDYPTLCGTGTEDYFGGAWNFGKSSFHSPYSGYLHAGGNEGEKAGARHAMYRFHLADPVYFHTALKVTIQALGWRGEGRFLPLQDDISATAYWYQAEPHAALPELPDRNGLEVI